MCPPGVLESCSSTLPFALEHMEISFYLKDIKAKDPTPIYCRICYNGRKAKVYIAEKIDPEILEQ